MLKIKRATTRNQVRNESKSKRSLNLTSETCNSKKLEGIKQIERDRTKISETTVFIYSEIFIFFVALICFHVYHPTFYGVQRGTVKN